jgi:ATP/maltotriose-dependent transcriptional regulator MalT
VRLLLARGSVRERAARSAEAFADHVAARDAARALGHRRLEMRALVDMGGDPSVALGRPPAACVAYLQEALDIADGLGDEATSVDILRRLSILETNRLRGEEARTFADAALARARHLGDAGVLATALDGRKTVAAYLGDLAVLTEVVEELEPLLVRTGRLGVLQWTVFEAALAPFARGEWEAALGGVERALDLSRRSGYHGYAGMFLAQLASIEWARGRLGAAVDVARRARVAADASGHPWWIGFSSAVLGGVLMHVGATREAVAVLEAGVSSAEGNGADLYLLHLLGPLAEGYALIGRRDDARAAVARTEELATRAGPPFLHAARGPLAAARAGIVLGDVERARVLLDRVHAAALAAGWVEPAAQAVLGLAEAELALGMRDDPRELVRALDLARSTGLAAIEFDALTALSILDGAHEADAARLASTLRGGILDPGLRRSFDERAARRRAAWARPPG